MMCLGRTCSARSLVLLVWSVAGLIAESFTRGSCYYSLRLHHCSTRRQHMNSLQASTDSSSKEKLLTLLSSLETKPTTTAAMERLPCGLECTDSERDQISQILSILEGEPSNLVVSRPNGRIQAQDLLGDWKLLYTSSRTMIINKSLSGLGRSSSSLATFAGLRQRLTGSKFLGTLEFIEQIGTGPDALEVRVTGEWTLEPETNPFTGQPGTAIRADLERISYGPTSNAAQDWNSLGPVRLLDVLYLDDDLQITRGNVNTDSIFVYQREG